MPGPSSAGSRVERGEQDEADRQHHAGGHGSERRDRHEEDCREAHQHGDAREEHGLAGGVHGDPSGVLRVLGVSVECRSVAGDDEQRVVDAEREREHHGEVQRPDREVGDLGDTEEHAHGSEQASGGEHEGEPGGSECAKGDHQDHGGDRPGEDLCFQHALAVDCVEVIPECGGTRQCHGDLVAGDLAGQIADVVAESFGGANGFGGVDVGAGLDHDGLAVHARLWRHRLAESLLGADQRVDVGDRLLERGIVDRCRPTLDHHDR